MTVDVVIPALDERESIGAVLCAIPRPPVRRVVVVDNGSRDGTAAVARAHGADVVREPRRGYGAACVAGIDHLAALDEPPEVVAFMDGDGSDDPGDLPRLLAALAGGADLAIGSRTLGEREGGSLTSMQLLGNALATSLVRARHGAAYSDLGPFRAARLATLRALDLRDRGFGWTVEMQVRAARAGLRVVEVPVRHRRRRGGRSKISRSVVGSLRAGARILYEALRPR